MSIFYNYYCIIFLESKDKGKSGKDGGKSEGHSRSAVVSRGGSVSINGVGGAGSDLKIDQIPAKIPNSNFEIETHGPLRVGLYVGPDGKLDAGSGTS
jgi:hypothetical protein